MAVITKFAFKINYVAHKAKRKLGNFANYFKGQVDGANNLSCVKTPTSLSRTITNNALSCLTCGASAQI